jgi:Carboxypeptidase regulatory-like domain
MNGPTWRRRWRAATLRRPSRCVAVAVVIAALFVLPVGTLGSAPLVETSSNATARSFAPLASGTAAANSLAGAAPSSRTVDAPSVYRAYHSRVSSPPPPEARNSSPPPTSVRSAPPPTAASVASSPAGAGGGWVAGTVVDSLYGTAVAGVLAESSTGSLPCPYCQGVTTNTTGFFRVEADPGTVTVEFTDSDYVSNLTSVAVTSGSVVSIGTVEMVHLATVFGTVVADLPGLPGLANVSVTSISRDYGETGPGLNFSSSNGSFEISVDPLPVEVDFAAPGPQFLSNSTDADPTAWQDLDLGTIRLEGGVTVSLDVVDSVTGLAVPNATGRFCSDRISGVCFQFGSTQNGTLDLDSLAGPGYVAVGSGGYVTNVTQVANVPAGSTGPVALGTVRLLPVGFVEVTVNFTGGTPNGTWSTTGAGVPGFQIATCSLSGMESSLGAAGQQLPGSCLDTPASLGETVLAAAAPLRNVVYVLRCYPVPGGFPLAEYGIAPPGQCTPPGPNGQIPTANISWANVTPDRVTDLGSLDVEAGTYLTGSLVVTGPSANSSALTVIEQVCSTVRLSVCAPSSQSGASGPGGPVPAGCLSTAWTFCAAAPPGPDRLSISWGPVQNGTWLTVPTGCCSQEGHPTNVGSFGIDTDLGPMGSVHGSVGLVGLPAGSAPPGGWDGFVLVCPAVPSPLPCDNATLDSQYGTFATIAPAGWDVVTASVTGYRQNWTWVDVVGNNSTGTIELTEEGLVEGQVVSASTGDPVLEAQVDACNVASGVCLPLGVEEDSNGTFAYSLPTVPYPGGTFQFEVTAAGYDPESTFANVTAGASTALPTIRLPPVGDAGGLPSRLAPRGANSSTSTTGSWVVGRLIDRSSGLGVGLALITVCELLAANACSFSSASSATGGEFNLSTVHGSYEVWFNSTYYGSDEVYLNATAAGTVNLGDLDLSELPRVTGRVVIDPWESLGTSLSEGADQVVVTVCGSGLQCGPEGVTGPGGYFNVSAPSTGAVSVSFGGSGPVGLGGNGLPGYSSSVLAATVVGSGTQLNGSAPGGAIPLSILGGVTGYLDESGGGPTRPAAFATYAVTGNRTGPSAGFVVGGAGYYVAFLPAGANGTSTDAGAAGLVPGVSAVSAATVVAGRVVAGANLTLSRFGFVTAVVHDATGGEPLAGVFLTAGGSGGSNRTLVGSARTNGSGDVNVTAPPGNDRLTAGSPLYANWTSNTSVPIGGLDAFGPIAVTAFENGGLVILRSASVTAVSGPVVPGVFDNVSDRPVPQATVLEAGPGGVHAGPVVGNDLGQFFLAGDPVDGATVTITAPGFNPLTYGRNLSLGGSVVVAPLNLTAGGIVAGTVVAEPGNVTVPYATVTACPVANPFCPTTVTTNATGAFWIAAPNGSDTVNVVSNLFLTNLSRIVSVPSDSFVELGDVPVYSFGSVRGVVRGLPSGAILPGANVSLCSQFSPPDSCLPDESVTTDANGTFTLDSPPGLYFFYAALPGYNASRFELVIGPGENLDLGAVVLQADGVETGTVVTSTGAPVGNATLLSCAAYSGGLCVGTTSAADGGFSLSAPPGPSELTVSAPGFLDTTVRVVVVSGALADLGLVVLLPTPPDVFENVTGFVTAASTGAALPGASVVAVEAGARVGQSYSRQDGSYDLAIRWGTVTLFVGIPGYRPENLTLAVHTNVTDLNFSLARMTYAIVGVTFDGGTGTVLSGVVLVENGSTVATSDAAGTFRLALPNGTATLVASHPAVGAVQYGSVRVPVTVNGASVVRDVTVPRSVVPLTGSVVDAATGAAIPSAAVAIWTPGGSEVSNGSTVPSGAFSFALDPGSYNLSVSAPGYAPANVSVSTGPAGTHTTIALTVGTARGTTGSSLLVDAEVGAAVAVAAALAAAAVLWRRSRRPPEGERYYPPGEPVELGEDEVT